MDSAFDFFVIRGRRRGGGGGIGLYLDRIWEISILNNRTERYEIGG